MPILTEADAPPFIPEVVSRLAELEDDLTGIVTTMQRVIGGLVLMDDADGVDMVTEQARTVERFRVDLVALKERLDPDGDLA